MRTHLSAALRFYVSASVGVNAAIAGWDPSSQHRFAMSEDGYGGLIAVAALALLALAGMVDVLINDVLPERYSLRCTHRHRHVVFMLIAIGMVALILALVMLRDIKPVASRYLLDAVAAAWIAIWGVIDHARAERQARMERASQRGDL